MPDRPRVRRWRPATEPSAQARATVAGVVRLQVLANGLGWAVVVLYLEFLFPVRTSAARAELNLVVLAIFLGGLLVVAIPLNVMVLNRAVRWVRRNEPPTARERWLVLRLPFLETVSALVSWIAAAVLFGIINRDASRVSIGITLAGLVTCTLLYLLLEGHFRPVFALALVHADLPENRRDVLPRLMAAWLLGSGVPFAALGLASLVETSRFQTDRLPWMAGVGVIAGGLVMTVAAASVARPLNRVRAALREVEQGNLDVHLPVDDLGELGRLAEGVNDLVDGLRERDALRDMFGRQVGPAELAELADGFDSADGERREVTVLFVDLQGYTKYAERHEPERVVAMLNRFFRVVVAVVNREGGWVNKFEGDAALCIFGAPTDQPDHALRALRAAEAIPGELARTPDVLPVGVGVATGQVLAGFVGTAERFEYTVIGDVVNLAARLCERAKEHRSGVLATLDTVEAGEWPDPWIDAGRLRLRGRSERAPVATLLVTRSTRPTRTGRSRSRAFGQS